MLEGFKNMAGLAGMMKDLPRLRERMEEVRERLGELEVEAETGGGAVVVRANGRLRIISVEVDQTMMSGLVDSSVEEDRALAQELIAGAVNAALEKAQQRAAEEFGRVAEDLGVPLPPGALQGLV